jgi:hypothetical protein
MKNNKIKQVIIDFLIAFIIFYITIAYLTSEINVVEWHILVRAFHIVITFYLFVNIQLNRQNKNN